VKRISGNIVTPQGVIEEGFVDFEGERILAVGKEADFPSFSGELHRFPGQVVFPGLIDLHLHGWQGYDVTEHQSQGVRALSKLLPSLGVTGFLPTTLTTSWENLLHLLREVAEVKAPAKGARILGLHLEGPYLSPHRAGAHELRFLRLPTPKEIRFLLSYGGGCIKRLTIAPELEGALESIAYLAHQGVLVSLGHSKASYREAQEAFLRGARLVTHLFNGMDPLHHRQPNLLAFALDEREIYAEIIADTVHVREEILRIALSCKGLHHLFPVSDAIKVGGLPDGVYPYSPEPVVLAEGKVVLAKSRMLAGSVCPLSQVLFHLRETTSLSLQELAWMGSTIPAKLLGIDQHLGSIAVGKIADFVIFDSSFRVQGVFISGERVR